MNIAYFGSPMFSAQLLDSLFKQSEDHIKLIVTQPDKPAGKRLSLTPTAVKTYAKTLSIKTIDHSIDTITEKQILVYSQKYSIDLCITFAYGSKIPMKLIRAVRYGFWNIHPSLLPKYRGAAPIIFPIALGDKKTGLTLIQMNGYMDEGDIIDQLTIPIGNNTTRIDIEKSTIPSATQMIICAMKKLKTKKNISFYAQNHIKATYTRRITKNDGYIPFDLFIKSQKRNVNILLNQAPQLISSYYKENKLTYPKLLPAGKTVWNLYKALYGWPGIWTVIKTANGLKRLKINTASFDGSALCIKSVQIEGKKEITFDIFNKAYNIL